MSRKEHAFVEKRGVAILFQKLVATTVSAAFLLEELSINHPHLKTSTESARVTLEQFNTHEKETRKRGHSPNVTLQRMISSASYSTVLDCVAGHRDIYSKKANKEDFETKITFIEGQPVKGLTLDYFIQKGKLPPGCLAFPAYGIATICPAMQDIELHQLAKQGILHYCARSQLVQQHLQQPSQNVEGPGDNEDHGIVCRRQDINQYTQNGRGAWYRNRKNGQWQFYPSGFAVCRYR